MFVREERSLSFSLSPALSVWASIATATHAYIYMCAVVCCVVVFLFSSFARVALLLRFFFVFGCLLRCFRGSERTEYTLRDTPTLATRMSKLASTTASSNTPLASIPSLHAFDHRSIAWDSYRDRIGFYFKANRIEDAEDKKAFFLWSVGDSTYNLLQSFVSPDTLTADTVSYDYIIKLLDAHYDAQQNIMTATHDFYTCMQKPGQTFAEWKAELLDKLRHCGFTKSVLKDRPQDRALRDMYVIGVRSPKIRQALLKEQDPDLDKTERIIQLAERLESDVRHFSVPTASSDFLVARVVHRRAPPSARKSLPPRSLSPCQTCGSTQHLRENCKFREQSCNHCKRKGHLERVCRQKVDKSTFSQSVHTIYKLAAADRASSPSARSTLVSLQVNSTHMQFELDTGTLNTLVSRRVWRQIGSPQLRHTTLNLTCYGGQQLVVCGEASVSVNHDQRRYDLSLVVVDNDGPSLLGLQWLRVLRLDLNSLVHTLPGDSSPVHALIPHDNLAQIQHQFRHVLNTQLGHCTKVQAHIHLRTDAVPRFFKPRSLPFAYMEGVKIEIERNVAAGVLERVDTSPWATPIVPIRKSNGTFRICGDFKVTINPQMLVDQHPLPSIDELFSRMHNGRRFTKLDLSDAYLQVELDDASKSLTVINTPMGLFRYNRMPFGIANAPALFQNIMDQVVAGIPHCAAYMDDLLLTGPDERTHLQILTQVLTRLSEFGFTCNPTKCVFFATEVSYLGFIIDEHGKRPDPGRVDAIIRMPAPQSVKQLEAFIGKLNYYRQFIHNFADECVPLNRLRHADVEWQWTTACQTAFDTLLRAIADATTLAHFDARLPIILATDASNYGLGAVLLHRYPDRSERPIAHASKTLSAAEQNYSQIEEEALSIIYGVKKFHQYLAGRTFELFTDHQPLLSIFRPDKALPLSSTSRIQRWAIFLMGYQFTIRYKRTHQHANADALSRLPVGPDATFNDDSSLQVHSVCEQLLETSLVDASQIAKATDTDDTMKLVKRFVLTQWPAHASSLPRPDLLPFFHNRQAISETNGCLVKDAQVIVPPSLQDQVLRLLHRSHLGKVKMKQLARNHCWWPGIDRDIDKLTRSCPTCAELQPLPKQQFHSWEEPCTVWSRVHMDFAGPVWGSKWLLIIDAKSKFPMIIDMHDNTTAPHLSQALDHLFDWFGPPQTFVSDNGPPFTSYHMQQFYLRYGITHVTTAPYHPASNGIAERFVRSFKEAMAKAAHTGQTDKAAAVRSFLRAYRWTPHTSTGLAPANMMLQHSVRTDLDRMRPSTPSSPAQQPAFFVGQPVWALQFAGGHRSRWVPAVITRSIGSIVYEVTLSTGQIVKRHANQLRNRSTSASSGIDIDSLPDDLTLPQAAPAVVTTAPSPRRNPARQRRPPNRFSP